MPAFRERIRRLEDLLRRAECETIRFYQISEMSGCFERQLRWNRAEFLRP
ncbi:MAG TPA: hypothetical protein H9683_02900 [Firmicutes bacterium]|nr:hypothetical protein [Bacillota bacterium]